MFITIPPFTAYPTPDSSMILDFDGSACKRLISSVHSQQQVIELLGKIFTSEDEVKMIGYLREGHAEAFINELDKVRSTPPFSKARSDYPRSLLFFRFRTFTFHQLGLGSPQSPTTAPEEVLERFV